MRSRVAAALAGLKGSDTGKAAWLAGAMIGNNVIALIASVIFARLLSDYGALAALISYLIILTVAGQALQVATAREGVLGHLGTGEDLLHTLERWWRALLIFTVLATVVSILARHPIAALVGVQHNRGGEWAAAVGIPAGCMYLELSILRGALQSIGDYRSVGMSLIGEQAARLIPGAILAAAGLGLAGAYLGSFIAYIVMAGYCAIRLYGQLAGPDHRRWGVGDAGRAALSLRRHIRHAAVPIAGLAVIQLLQNVDLIIAKHRMTNKVDSSYAVAAVAAKVLIWVAMGASFYLVPETSRRANAGEDTRVVLAQSLGIILVCAVPCLAIFAVGAHPLLAAVFGTKRAVASSSLLPLGAAFTVLAATYLAVQYMLALKHTWFLVGLALVAAIEPVLLLEASHKPAAFAAVVLGVQALGAVLAFSLALWPAKRRALSTAAAATVGFCVVLGIAFSTGSHRAEAAEPPALTVSGNQLLSGGQPLRVAGVNRNAYAACNDGDIPVYDAHNPADPTDAFADGPVDQASVTAMTDWSINVVRLPISESCWLGLAGQPSDGESAAAYQTQVENYVNLLGANGLYVILDLESTAPPGYASAGIDTLPDEADAPAFWSSMTSVFGGDRFVMFDLINEVSAATYDSGTVWSNNESALWNCWLNGCEVASQQDYDTHGNPVTYQSAGMQQLVNTVRANDSTTPLIIGSPDYNFDKADFSEYPVSDTGNTAGPQLIYDTHLYDFADFGIQTPDDTDATDESNAVTAADSYIDSTIVPIADSYPVMVGELGQEDCDDTSTGTAPFTAGVLTHIAAIAAGGTNLGVLGWTFDANTDSGSPVQSGWSCPTDNDGDGGPLLIRDFIGTPTVMGQTFLNFFQGRDPSSGVPAPGAVSTTTTSAAPPVTTMTTTTAATTTPVATTAAPRTAASKTALGDAELTLTTPAATLCLAATGKLAVELSSVKLKTGLATTVTKIALYIGKGVEHITHTREKVHGKLTTVKLTTYTANATAIKLPLSAGLSLKGLAKGAHVLTVKITYRQSKSVKVTQRGRTVTTKKTATAVKTLTKAFRTC